MSTLRRAELDAFVRGAMLLGSGGGGDAALYSYQLATLLPDDGVELIPLAEAVAGGLGQVAPIGMIGATSVLSEKLPHGGEIGEAIAALQRWTGRTVEAVMPVEAAGLNAALAVAAACELGLPLVDCDLMGRALPRFDQLSLVAAQPELLRCAALCEPGGQLLIVDHSSPAELERTVRSHVANAGGWAGAAFGPVAATDLVGRVCEGTLERALMLGRSLSGTEDAGATAVTLGGRFLAAGRVIDVRRPAVTSAQFGRGSFAVTDRGGPVLRIEAENEYLVAFLDGEPVVSCPELICVLDRRTAESIAVERLRAGDDVQVIALPGPIWWTSSSDRVATVGPRAFGIDLDPVLLGAAR
ncbi:MAG: DUF917 domain-containing protein [Nakamurella sp.]